MTKRQLKLLRYLYRKPRTLYWIKKKFNISDLRDIASGIFHLIRTTDDDGEESEIITLSKEGIIEVENRQWFNGQFVLTQILLPIVIAIITTLLTLFLSSLL